MRSEYVRISIDLAAQQYAGVRTLTSPSSTADVCEDLLSPEAQLKSPSAKRIRVRVDRALAQVEGSTVSRPEDE
jgi:hypothetical protein